MNTTSLVLAIHTVAVKTRVLRQRFAERDVTGRRTQHTDPVLRPMPGATAILDDGGGTGIKI